MSIIEMIVLKLMFHQTKIIGLEMDVSGDGSVGQSVKDMSMRNPQHIYKGAHGEQNPVYSNPWDWVRVVRAHEKPCRSGLSNDKK